LNIPQACLQAVQHNEDLSSDDDFKSKARLSSRWHSLQPLQMVSG
jgi:hypothetical protein